MLSGIAQLEATLQTHRFWRDIGTALLLLGVFVETLIDNFWPESTVPSIWHGLRNIALPKGRLEKFRKPTMVIVGVVLVFGGIALEFWQGTLADSESDGIRQDQEAHILATESQASQSNQEAIDALKIASDATERAIRLLRIEGNRQLIDDGSDQFENLAKFKGVPVWIETTVSFAAGPFAWLEPEDFANSFFTLRRVGWDNPTILNRRDPRRAEILAGPDIDGVHIYSREPDTTDPVFRNRSPDEITLDSPEKKEWAAAEALTRYLRSIGSGPVTHWSFSDELPKGFPPNGIFITIGSHDAPRAITEEERNLEDAVWERRRVQMIQRYREQLLRKSK